MDSDATTSVAAARSWALRTPRAVALLHHEQHNVEYTYEELMRAAEDAAIGLATAGVASETPVADFCDEAPALLIAFYAIAIAGGVVVPLDAAAPEARLAAQLDDCSAPFALCEDEWLAALSVKLKFVQLVSLEAARRQGVAAGIESSACVALSVSADAPCHLIFTSGSTGRPKGVLVTHGAMHAYARAKSEAHRIDCASRVLLTSAHTWDPCIGDVFSTLAVGGTLCSAPRAHLLQEIGPTMRALSCTHVCTTPSLWSLLSLAPAALPALQCVALGGETLPFALIHRWLSARPRLVVANTYGVTEATVYQTLGECITPHVDGDGARASQRLTASAGRPLRGVLLAIIDAFTDDDSPADVACGTVDESRAEVACGAGELGAVSSALTGEVLLGGVQLARGYHRRPELTAQRFVQSTVHPIAGNGCMAGAGTACAAAGPSRRWFRTGDLGEWCHGDGLRLLGRLDAQVKLRGVRIELEELEAVAKQSRIVRAAAAAVVADQLILYLVPRASVAVFEAAGGEVAVRVQLRRWLPQPAQPARLVALAHFPLTPGGKLLRSALPPPPPVAPSPRVTADATCDGAEDQLEGRTERAVAAAWSRALPGSPAVGPRDNFFDLGGSSLRAVQMLRDLRNALDAQHGGGTDAFERGNQRFATRLCGLYRRPRLRDFCVWLEWAALPAPDASGGASTSRDALDAFSSRRRIQGIGPIKQGSAAGAGAGAGGAGEDGAVTAADFEPPQVLPAAPPRMGTPLEGGDVVAQSEDCRSGALLAAGDLALPESHALAAYATEALARAALHGDRTLVGELLAAQADVDGGVSRHRKGLSPLMHAAGRAGRDSAGDGAEVVATLLAAGASVNLVSPAHSTAAHYAAAANAHATLAMLTRSVGFAMHARDLNRWSALYYAAHRGSDASVQLLIDLGARVRAADRWGRTPLCWACTGGHVHVAASLLRAGAPACGNSRRPQVAHLERHGQVEWATPLHLALHSLGPHAGGAGDASGGGTGDANGGGTDDASGGLGSEACQLALPRLLLAFHADPLARDQRGRTALDEAARLGHQHAVALMRATAVTLKAGTFAHDRPTGRAPPLTATPSAAPTSATICAATEAAAPSEPCATARDRLWYPMATATVPSAREEASVTQSQVWIWPPISNTNGGRAGAVASRQLARRASKRWAWPPEPQCTH